MNLADADRCFQRDYAEARVAVARLTTGQLPRLVEVVLVDMAFNLGERGLSRFKLLLAAIARRDYKTAATELWLSHYALQCPHRVERLCALLNRAAEKESDAR
jgi:GH24 family phage-related lysozyme (muramidase)